MDVDVLFLQFQNLRCESLPQVQYHAAAERRELHFVGYLFAHFGLVVYLACVADAYLCFRIGHIVVVHHKAVAVNLKVSLVGVDDDIVVGVRAVHLGYHIAERVLKDVHESLTVDVLEFLEL